MKKKKIDCPHCAGYIRANTKGVLLCAWCREPFVPEAEVERPRRVPLRKGAVRVFHYLSARAEAGRPAGENAQISYETGASPDAYISELIKLGYISRYFYGSDTRNRVFRILCGGSRGKETAPYRVCLTGETVHFEGERYKK